MSRGPYRNGRTTAAGALALRDLRIGFDGYRSLSVRVSLLPGDRSRAFAGAQKVRQWAAAKRRG